ncbi:bifunctional folylpolyglutamate synthase/dihydrofolate synthase, partial [bacterium]|nr:bifunctional folylpolyglutamate synthase/dihydrofolate synthase [bacterium]
MTKELQYLFSKRRFGRKPGLEQISALLNDIGNPENKFKTIHIAGTNGKGSTAAILQNILISSGRKGRQKTSPHRIRYHERIRIYEQEISHQDVSR